MASKPKTTEIPAADIEQLRGRGSPRGQRDPPPHGRRDPSPRSNRSGSRGRHNPQRRSDSHDSEQRPPYQQHSQNRSGSQGRERPGQFRAPSPRPLSRGHQQHSQDRSGSQGRERPGQFSKTSDTEYRKYRDSMGRRAPSPLRSTSSRRVDVEVPSPSKRGTVPTGRIPFVRSQSSASLQHSEDDLPPRPESPKFLVARPRDPRLKPSDATSPSSTELAEVKQENVQLKKEMAAQMAQMAEMKAQMAQMQAQMHAPAVAAQFALPAVTEPLRVSPIKVSDHPVMRTSPLGASHTVAVPRVLPGARPSNPMLATVIPAAARQSSPRAPLFNIGNLQRLEPPRPALTSRSLAAVPIAAAAAAHHKTSLFDSPEASMAAAAVRPSSARPSTAVPMPIASAMLLEPYGAAAAAVSIPLAAPRPASIPSPVKTTGQPAGLPISM
jgi:hypothetical protein